MDVFIKTLMMRSEASMLLPALGKAKTKAQGIMCMGNGRQLACAWLMYASDNNDTVCQNLMGNDLAKPAPSDLFMFVDEHPDSIKDGWLIVQPNTPALRGNDLPASDHNFKEAVSAPDGNSTYYLPFG